MKFQHFRRYWSSALEEVLWFILLRHCWCRVEGACADLASGAGRSGQSSYGVGALSSSKQAPCAGAYPEGLCWGSGIRAEPQELQGSSNFLGCWFGTTLQVFFFHRIGGIVFWCFQFCLSQLIPWCYFIFFLFIVDSSIFWSPNKMDTISRNATDT